MDWSGYFVCLPGLYLDGSHLCVVDHRRLMANRIIGLVNHIEQMTDGQCTVGAGPFGLGVSNIKDSEISLFIHERPMFYPIFPEEQAATQSTITVMACRNDTGEVLSSDELHVYRTSDHDEVTRAIAKTVDKLSKTPVMVTKEEYDAAYEILADRQLTKVYGEMQMV